MTHHNGNHSKGWIEFSRTREQMRYNARKELVYFPPLVAMFIIIALFPSLIGFAIGSFVGGFTGLIMLRQREVVSSMVTLRGKPAVAVGLFFVLLGWGGAVLAVLVKIFKW